MRSWRRDFNAVIPGWCVSTRPGISRFRVRYFVSPRNDGVCFLEPLLFWLLKPIYNDGPDHLLTTREVTSVAAKINPLAGKPADPSMLANIPRLVTAYFAGQPDPKVAAQRVAFGTSGHRGSALNHAFNEAHIVAISQALCDHRNKAGVSGPLFVGIDTH